MDNQITWDSLSSDEQKVLGIVDEFGYVDGDLSPFGSDEAPMSICVGLVEKGCLKVLSDTDAPHTIRYNLHARGRASGGVEGWRTTNLL